MLLEVLFGDAVLRLDAAGVLRDEAVADARLGHQVARDLGVGFDLPAQPPPCPRAPPADVPGRSPGRRP
jgi:hypothetical protein